jgi:C4-dicarboxylate-specific signal transduction histidine kinase
VAILDRAGIILQVNEQWREAGIDVARGFFARTFPGDDYVSAWEKSLAEPHASSGLVGRQVKSVLAGQTSHAVLERQFSTHDLEARWLEIRCNVLQWPQGGAVLSHVDITERKRSDMQAERNLQTLSQFHRVAALGELAGALAHELNQPLAAILINAESLDELLALEMPPNAEAREVVREIVSDDERAGQIIRKMRALLQDRANVSIALNLTEIAASVVKLLANEAMLRKVILRCELTADLPLVLGDTVQLQQVVLNLAMNAMDAVKDVPEGARTVTVATFLGAEDAVVVEVSDTGPGIAPAHLPRLFDHFFTTKREGLGLGLSISRSIVESLHGRIEADNCLTGARFRVSMPVVQVRSAEEAPA